uniref:Uncharacterized protein n=1 Tax=Arundo donax TaxID=35708 RepID=A0A0A8ZJ36_ARUDO
MFKQTSLASDSQHHMTQRVNTTGELVVLINSSIFAHHKK